jgi:hypothetical protein
MLLHREVRRKRSLIVTKAFHPSTCIPISRWYLLPLILARSSSVELPQYSFPPRPSEFTVSSLAVRARFGSSCRNNYHPSHPTVVTSNHQPHLQIAGAAYGPTATLVVLQIQSINQDEFISSFPIADCRVLVRCAVVPLCDLCKTQNPCAT